MNGFAALDIPPCRRYVVVKVTAGFAVCRLILKLLLFYSCLDFTQNLGKTPQKQKRRSPIGSSFSANALCRLPLTVIIHVSHIIKRGQYRSLLPALSSFLVVANFWQTLKLMGCPIFAYCFSRDLLHALRQYTSETEMFVTLTPHPTKSKSAVTAVAVTNANFFFIYSLPTLL